MKPRSVFLSLALLAAASASAQTMYKCVDAGVTTYAERPCGKSAVVISVTAAPAGDARTTQPSAIRAEQRQAQLAELSRERRLRELDTEIADAERQLDADLARLRRRTRYFSDELAAATWRNGVALEMQAVTAKGTARIDALRRERAALRDQIAASK
jgi:hypothetical protein